MKKRFLLGTALLAATALSVVSATAYLGNRKDTEISGKSRTYDNALNHSNGLTNADYAMKQSATADFAKFNYFLAKQSATGHAVLAPHGAIFNYDSSGNMSAIHGVENVTVTYTSTSPLMMRIMLDDDGKYDSGKVIEVTSGEEIELREISPNFLRFEAGDSSVDIESIEFTYTCRQRQAIDDDSIFEGVYTGMKDDTAYKLTLGDYGQARVETMNKPGSQDVYEGYFTVGIKTINLVLEESIELELDFSDDYTSLTVNTDSGAGSMFGAISLTKVFEVENYESYSATGVGLDQSHSIYSTSGLRSAYHSDYYAKVTGKTSLFGDANWSYMGSSDYITLGAGMGVDGSNCAVFKSNSNSLRYVSMNSFVESSRRLGKGSTFSFWAHGAVSNLSSPTSNGKDTNVKVRIFYKNGITACSDSTGVATTITIPAGSDWTQYEIALDTTKEFYGYSFFFNNSATGYVPIDNIQMYDVNPNMVYVAPKAASIEGTYYTSAEISALSQTHSVIIALDKSGKATVKVSGVDAGATAYTYDTTTHEVSIPTTGSVPTYGFTYGTITGTLNTATGVLENVNFDGTAGDYVTDNGSLTAVRPGTYFDCEGSTGDMQTTFKRRYDNGGGWSFDTGNADRLVANSEAAAGDSSVKLRCLGDGNTSHKTALTLANDLSITNANNISFFVLNDTGVEFVIRVFIYKGAGMTSNQEIAQITIPTSSQWKFCQTGFNLSGATLYNFQLFIGVPSGVTSNFYPSFDDICIW